MGLVSISSCGGRAALLGHWGLEEGIGSWMVGGREICGQGRQTIEVGMRWGRRRNRQGEQGKRIVEG